MGEEKGKGGEETIVRPDVFQAILMDDIVSKLTSIENIMSDVASRIATLGVSFESLDKKVGGINTFLDDTAYKGDIRIFKKVITGGEGNKKITCNKKWYEHTIVNDGPDDVHIESAAKTMSDTPIEMGEEVTVKAKRGSTDPVWLRCVSEETATVRVVFKF